MVSKRQSHCALICALVFVYTFSASASEEIDLSSTIGFEIRHFTESPLFADQLEDNQLSLTGEFELEWENEDRTQQAALIPYFRLDSEDDERSHGDLREAYWRIIGDEADLLIGLNRVFWGVTESRHLINIINQVDAVENIDEEDYLGQPMINLRLQKELGRFDFYVLPYFREKTFSGVEGRLRGPLVVDQDNAIYESGDEENRIDTAIRYSHYFGNWDVGISWFHGTGREPTLIPNESGTAFIPLYSVITQTSLDLQYTGDQWLWKAEIMTRRGQGERFSAYVAGFEYSIYQVMNSQKDLGILVEFLRDNRDDTAPVTILQDDVFAGVRLGFNDMQDSSLLAGLLYDLDDGTSSFRFEGERRLGQNWKIELETQIFTNIDSRNSAAAFGNDDFLQLSMTRYW